MQTVAITGCGHWNLTGHTLPASGTLTTSRTVEHNVESPLKRPTSFTYGTYSSNMILHVTVSRRHTCRWRHCDTSACRYIASADSHAPSSDRRTRTRSYAAWLARMTSYSWRSKSSRPRNSWRSTSFRRCDMCRDRCTCSRDSSQLKYAINFTLIQVLKTNCLWHDST